MKAGRGRLRRRGSRAADIGADATRGPSTIVVLAVVAALGLTALLSTFPILSFDVWWHLRTGRLILETGRIPFTDSFTYTATGRPWITHEWLSEVMFYLLERAGGTDALVIFKVVLATLAVGLGAAAGVVGSGWRRRLPAAALGIVLAGALIAPRAFVRPHMLTAVLLGATLLLLRLESETGERRWRRALVPLFLVWANLHSGFLLGLGLIALYWIGEAMATRLRGAGPTAPPAWRARGVTLAATVAATLVNPHHVHALLYPIKLVLRPEVRGSIVELRSVFHPAYRGALFLDALVVAAVVTTILLVASRRRISWALLLPGLMFWALAIRTIRSVSELAVVAPALIAVHGTTLGTRRRTTMAIGGMVIAASLVGGGAIIRDGTPMGADPPRRVGLGVDPSNCPRAAVAFLRHVNPPGRIFNPLGFGGYLIHELWPEKRVFVDGRLDVFPPGFLERYQRLWDLAEGWDETVAGYGIATAIVNYQSDPTVDRDLRARLRNDPDWVCVFIADDALVYVRRIPDNADILARFGCPFDPGRRTEQSAQAFAAGAAPGEVDRAIAAIENMLEIAPDQTAPVVVAGNLLRYSGRPAEAAPWFRRALDADPRNVQLAIDLTDLERDAGRPEAALKALEQAAAVDSGSYLIQLRLGVLNAQLDRLDRAEACFLRAIEIRPDDPSAMQNLARVRALRKP